MWQQFGVALAAFAVLDGLWLGVVMRNFYRRHLAHLARARARVRWPRGRRAW